MHFAYHGWFQYQMIAASGCCIVGLEIAHGNSRWNSGARSNRIEEDVYDVCRGIMQRER